MEPSLIFNNKLTQEHSEAAYVFNLIQVERVTFTLDAWHLLWMQWLFVNTVNLPSQVGIPEQCHRLDTFSLKVKPKWIIAYVSDLRKENAMR